LDKNSIENITKVEIVSRDGSSQSRSTSEIEKDLLEVKAFVDRYQGNSVFSQPSIYIDGFSQPSIYINSWLYGTRMTSVVCNVPVLSQNDSTYHHSVFTT